MKPTIPVTRPYLPDRKKVNAYLDWIYESRWLTNNGPLVRELEERLADYLGVENLLLVANGTLALEVAYRTLGVSGSAVTTPFTFVATASSLKWLGIEPVFGDIDSETLNLRPDAAEGALRPNTTAVVPVHVYGIPCEVEGFKDLARRCGVSLIYDASHTFGVNLGGESLLNWGDAATLSFHATKVFHTVEGGAIHFARQENAERARSLINFGLEPGSADIREVGCNAKMSEMHAAMGLAMLDDMDVILEQRATLQRLYWSELGNHVEFPKKEETATCNGAYVPILLPDRETRDRVQAALAEQSVHSKAYFYPSLMNTEAYGKKATGTAPEANKVASRVLCLPVSHDLTVVQVRDICEKVQAALG